MSGLVVLAAAILGACVGSFLNVVVHRVPRGESIISPPSHCPSCGVRLSAIDNVPILAWPLLRGRCRHCGAPISPRYFLIELLTASMWAASAFRFERIDEAIVVAVATSVLIALSFIDLEHRRLPNVIVLPAAALATAWAAVDAALDRDPRQLLTSLVSAAAVFALFLLIALISGGMGMGDVKLAGVIGLVTGWFSPAVTAAAVFFAFMIGGLASVVLLVAGRAKRKSAIPFGPALAAGAIAALFVGAQPVRSYLGI